MVAGALLGWGCGPELPEPSLVTPLGVRVYLHGQTVSAQEVDAYFQAVMEEFADRFESARAQRATEAALLSLLPVETYVLDGRPVAGNVSGDGQWIFVATVSGELSKTALAHELVHYFDLRLFADTDPSHRSWAERIYPGLERVQLRVAPRPQVE